MTNWPELESKYYMQTIVRVPITLVKGEGASVWDDEGREYLDFVCGLAVSTKYNAAVAAAAVLLAVILTQQGARLLQAVLLVPTGLILGFFAGTPQALRQPTIFLQDVAQQIIDNRFGGRPFTEQPNTLVSYLWFLLTDGLGIGLSLLAIVGVYAAVRRFRGPGLVFLTAGALFLLQMGAMRNYFTRNLAVIAPVLALFCGFGALELFKWAEKLKIPAPRLAAAAAVALLAIPSMLGSVGISTLLSGPNNFLIASEWIEETLPRGSGILIEHSDPSATIPLPEDTELAVTRIPYVPARPIRGLKKNFDYAVTWKNGPHRFDHYRYGDAVFQPGGYAQIQERYGGELVGNWEEFKEAAVLVKEFNPFELGSQGPTIQVWRLQR